MPDTLNWTVNPSNIKISVIESTIEISNQYCTVFHVMIEDNKQCYSLIRYAEDFDELDTLVHKYFPKHRIPLPKLNIPNNHLKHTYSMRSILSSIKNRKKKTNSELLEIYLFRCAFTKIGKTSLFHDFLSAQRDEDRVSSKTFVCQLVSQHSVSVGQTEDQPNKHVDVIMTPYTLNRKKSFAHYLPSSQHAELSIPIADIIPIRSTSTSSSDSCDSISFADVATPQPLFPRYLDYYDHVDIEGEYYTDTNPSSLESYMLPELKSDAQKQTIKDYQLIKVLGKGATGKVILVKKHTSDTLYALKSITKSWTVTQREINHVRMERDILATMSTIRHPFLIKLHAAFQDKNNLFLLLDYHAGADLATLLQRHVRFPPEQCRLYCAEMLMGLQELHRNNILYRDLKPENVLLAADGHIVLTDFGLSKMFDNSYSSDRYEHRTTTFCGTPEYLAPEIILQEEEYSYAADYWSLGTMLYEMLTGLLPFGSDTIEEMYNRVLYDDLLFPSSLDPETTDLIAGLLDRNPYTRLGAGPTGVFEIRLHPYFIRHFEWRDVYSRSIKPRYIPYVSCEADLGNFDPDFLQMSVTVDDEERLGMRGSNRRCHGSYKNELNESAFKGYSYVRIEEDCLSDESEISYTYENYADYDQDNLSENNNTKDYNYDSESESAESQYIHSHTTLPFTPQSMKTVLPSHHSLTEFSSLNCNQNIRNSLIIDSSVNDSTNITWIS